MKLGATIDKMHKQTNKEKMEKNTQSKWILFKLT